MGRGNAAKAKFETAVPLRKIFRESDCETLIGFHRALRVAGDEPRVECGTRDSLNQRDQGERARPNQTWLRDSFRGALFSYLLKGTVFLRGLQMAIFDQDGGSPLYHRT